ncbi:hypothetical protein Pmani_004866 [Petrolisthes manimaculis]|uniref:Uncharacterized protein n=1 Tax=Petrolisthes manimaculis TaxID=1843537 RepID=A0AAE1QDW3_9EUCA|nr:hypothetical protein Pmani_004866 [Petrolisthes manimaculis]
MQARAVRAGRTPAPPPLNARLSMADRGGRRATRPSPPPRSPFLGCHEILSVFAFTSTVKVFKVHQCHRVESTPPPPPTLHIIHFDIFRRRGHCSKPVVFSILLAAVQSLPCSVVLGVAPVRDSSADSPAADSYFKFPTAASDTFTLGRVELRWGGDKRRLSWRWCGNEGGEGLEKSIGRVGKERVGMERVGMERVGIEKGRVGMEKGRVGMEKGRVGMEKGRVGLERVELGTHLHNFHRKVTQAAEKGHVSVKKRLVRQKGLWCTLPAATHLTRLHEAAATTGRECGSGGGELAGAGVTVLLHQAGTTHSHTLSFPHLTHVTNTHSPICSFPQQEPCTPTHSLARHYRQDRTSALPLASTTTSLLVHLVSFPNVNRVHH